MKEALGEAAPASLSILADVWAHRSICSSLLGTGVPLFLYGSDAGDREFVRRTVDFTSPLFRPQIGFPLGLSLRDFLYVSSGVQFK